MFLFNLIFIYSGDDAIGPKTFYSRQINLKVKAMYESCIHPCKKVA